MQRGLLSVSLLTWAALGAGCSGATQVGDPCQTDDQCGREDGFALACQAGVPGGYCTVRDCTPDDPATEELEGEDTCPASARCVQDGVRPSFVCRRSCSTLGDCRDVWDCATGECVNRMSCALVHAELEPSDDAPRVCVYTPAEE
jgi:hypothetical protein